MVRSFLSIAASVTLLAMTASAALAAKPVEHINERIDVTFTENLCGIPVTTEIVGRENVLIYGDGSVRDTSSGTITWTNADGDWLQNKVAGPLVNHESLEGSILTSTSVLSGIPERLRSSEGITRAFDRGRIEITTVFDLHDLDDPTDDEFVSQEITRVAGPHPQAESDFLLFCEVVTEVLG